MKTEYRPVGRHVVRRAASIAATATFVLGTVVAPASAASLDADLLDAARRGDAQAVESLLRRGANVNAASGDGMSALHWAAECGHLEVAARLAAVADVAATTRIGHYTPLHLASRAGHVPIVSLLLEAGADPGAVTTNSGVTPLHLAAAALGGAKAVAALLEHGADPNARESSAGQTPLIFAAAANRAGAIRTLLAAGADPDASTAVIDVLANLALDREAARRLQEMTAEMPVDPDAWDGDLTPRQVQTAIRAQRQFLRSGYDVGTVTPHSLARVRPDYPGGPDVVRPPYRETLVGTTGGMTALLHASREGHMEQAGYLDLLRALLAAGADPNVRLHTHLWYWEYGLTKMGIDLTGATPFWRAAFAQDIEAMRLLADHGADPNIPTVWPEVGMRERRQQDGRQQEDSGLPYIPEGVPNAYPIHAAAGGGYLGLGAFSVRNRPNQFLPAVRYLVEEHGANVNLPDSWMYRPLHYAASRGDNALIEYLVSHGADVTAITRLGQSTADMARGGRAGFFTRVAYPETVELLVGLGASLECLHTHFLDTGDVCPGAGVNDPWAPPPVSTDGHAASGADRERRP